jgi:hypothetical protein
MKKILLAILILLSVAAGPFAHSANAQPEIVVSQSSFSFQGTEYDPATLTDTLTITNGGDGTLNWTASWSESWLDVLPPSGTAPSTVEIRVTAASAAAGDYSDQISLEAPDASNSPYLIDVNFHIQPSCEGICGDPSNDGKVNVSDVVYIINYVFIEGDPPQPVLACGDANGDSSVNVSDAVYTIGYIFVMGSPAPGDCSPGYWEGQGGDCCPFP